MSDNYIVINGKRTELTEEQLKLLGIETRKNPFERVAMSEQYYIIDALDDIATFRDEMEQSDDESFECSNYFNDKQFAKQVALHQLLYRKLLKFAYDYGCEDNQEWNGENRHWCIRYDHCDKVFDVMWYDTFQPSSVYFFTMESAERAIKEVVEPFLNEHPDFVW